MADVKASVVICGAGIAGISAAYQLAVKQGVRDILLVDDHAPLSVTSDKSTECYRNWWPGPGDAMVSLMNRSIDLLEELAASSDNAFHMNRRGYLYATAEPARIAEMKHAGEEAASLGAGPLRCHPGNATAYIPAAATGYASPLTGSDLILDPQLIRDYFPYLAHDTAAVLHARRCGWLSAQTLGMYELERARECGVRFRDGRVTGVEVNRGRVAAVRFADGTRVATESFVIAAGPFVREAARMVGVELPVFAELHVKAAFPDHAHVYPMQSPLLIWTDPQRIQWSDEERALFEEPDETRYLLREFPSGVHSRAEGGTFLVLWTYDTDPVEPVFPIRYDPHYPDIVMRGLARMIPALKVYGEKLPRPVVDGGYYLKTKENRPLIGPLPVGGAYVIGALSGYGVMASCAAGELLAAHLTGAALPDYAPAFRLDRYVDPAYLEYFSTGGASGQL